MIMSYFKQGFIIINVGGVCVCEKSDTLDSGWRAYWRTATRPPPRPE